MAMEGHDAAKISVRTTMKKPRIRRSIPDSAALNLVGGRSRSKEIETTRPTWIKYWIGLVRFMAPLTSLPTTPTETAGFLNRPVN